MVKSQKRVDTLTTKMTGLTDAAELQRVGQELSNAQAALDGYEMRWLDLAEQQES